MEEEQFRRLLSLFPVVRSRDYCAENEASNKTSAPSERDQQLMEWHDAWDELDAQENAAERSDREDPFWLHLRSSVAEKGLSTVVMLLDLNVASTDEGWCEDPTVRFVSGLIQASSGLFYCIFRFRFRVPLCLSLCFLRVWFFCQLRAEVYMHGLCSQIVVSLPCCGHRVLSQRIRELPIMAERWTSNQTHLLTINRMGAENAGQFCKAFQKVHEQLVYKALPLDAVRQITTHMDTSESGSQEQ